MVKTGSEDVPLRYDQYPVHWYVVCGIVAACVSLLVGLSVCVYQCYRRRATTRQSPDTRLSAAIRKGLLKEYNTAGVQGGNQPEGGTMTKSPSMRSTGSTLSGGSTQTGGPLHRDAPTSLFRAPGRSGAAPGGPAADEFGGLKPHCYTLNERDGAGTSPEEKGGSLKEKVAENDGKLSPTLGTLHFTVQYDSDKAALVVAVTQAKDLPVKDLNVGSSDPYVKLQLLPDKRQKVKTRVMRRTLNPIFDEVFTFYGIDDNQLTGITLHFVILSYDRFSRDDVIGEVIYPLSDQEICGKVAVPVCKGIIPRHIKMYNQGRGELLVSVCHHPAANRLTVVVLKARNLPKMDITGLSDPYVKIYLRYNGQRIAKKKTHVTKRTLNPVFNESFIFDLPPNGGGGGLDVSSSGNVLSNVSLELYVLDWDQMTKNEVIGRLEIGTTSSGEKFGEQEQRHWNEVMNCPRKQIAGWHKLVD